MSFVRIGKFFINPRHIRYVRVVEESYWEKLHIRISLTPIHKEETYDYDDNNILNNIKISYDSQKDADDGLKIYFKRH
jgi:hypothetical protein